MKLHDLDQTTAVTDALRSTLGHTFRVTNWMEYDQAASAGFAMLKRVYAIVLLLLIGVAAFNLIATLIMVVMEKRKDIAVLLAMGATPAEVRWIFQLKGIIVGAAGTALGWLSERLPASRSPAISSSISRAKSTASRLCRSTRNRSVSYWWR